MFDESFVLSPLIVFGVLSAILSTFAYLPYIRDSLAGRTRPQRASWLIWSVLGAIAFFSQVYEGATDSLWFAGAQVSGTIIVFVLSIRFGVGSVVNKPDALVLICASVGLLAWALTETSVYALAITICISLMGGAVTVMKAYRDPGSETLSTWALSFVASVFALMAVGALDWILLAYPAYLFTLNGAIVAAILIGRARQRVTLPVMVTDAAVVLAAVPVTPVRRPRSVFHMPTIRAGARERLRGARDPRLQSG